MDKFYDKNTKQENNKNSKASLWHFYFEENQKGAHKKKTVYK